jgi:LmbE family N-acetylglucosaminyl deacetylase
VLSNFLQGEFPHLNGAMIVPLTNEATWSPRLQHLPAWQPSDNPVLVVAPHPDDETLAVGGLIATLRARSVDVTVVAVTDGEHAYVQNEGLAAIRREEQANAVARLGLPHHKIVRLGLVDSAVAAQQGQLTTQLISLITPRTQVIAPWCGDFHPDHESCARAAAAATQSVAGATLISYFFWTWHRGTLATLEGLNLHKFVLTPDAMQAKREALACHVSQLQHAPEPEILPDNLLWPANMPFEVLSF